MAEIRARQWWPDRLLTDDLDQDVARVPDKVAIVDQNATTGGGTTLSYRQLRRLSTRIALGLVQLGVAPGDIVSCQLPNWWQFAALYLACARIGAVINPLMPIFRRRELAYMLSFCEAKVMVIPKTFRGFDHEVLLDQLRPELPALQRVLVLGSDDERTDFERYFLRRRWEDELDAAAVFAERRPSPDDVTLLLYTSGTTGEPKGVLHTHNTMLRAAAVLIEHLRLSGDDTGFMASPLAHVTGMLIGMALPIMLGAKVVLQDVWNPVRAAQLLQDEAATMTSGATPFLADLTQAVADHAYDISSFRLFHAGGSPIPRVLVQRASETMGIDVTTAWGMSELGLGTSTSPDDPPQKLFSSDGRQVCDAEVRVVDEQGAPLPPDTEGRLQVRCASLFVGYLKRPEAYGVDAGGWFETGDNARMDAEGYIRITSRAKDIIIRGGENIPVAEVEDLLYRHPAVQDAAIVAMPDERLGERGCAFVVLRPGHALSFKDMVDYLGACGLARNYLPERIEIITEMPRTLSGKIQKFKLREAAQAFPA